MIYTAPCVRFLMRADTLRGEVGVGGGGLALEISSFVGPCEFTGAHKTRDFQHVLSFFKTMSAEYSTQVGPSIQLGNSHGHKIWYGLAKSLAYLSGEEAQ
jgi:hypothetical protein